MKRCFYILLGAALSAPAAGETLTWADCRKRALKSNLELSIARLELRQAEAEARAVRSARYPDVTAKASKQFSGEEAGGNWIESERVSASLNASHSVFDGFGNRARISRADAELDAERANYNQTRSNVEYNLRRTFAEQLYVQKLITLAEQIAARREENIKLVSLRYEGGREHRGSLLLSRAQHAQALYETKEARRRLELARRELAKEIGWLRFEPFATEGELETSAPPEAAEIYTLAEATPSYRSAEAARRSAEAGCRITRSDRFPSISATASLGSSGETRFENESWSAGLSISLPLFRGGELSQDILASRLRREEAVLDEQNTLFELLVDLQEAWNRYRDEFGQMGVQAGLLEAAEVRAEIARTQYRQGLLSFEDWDRIEDNLIAHRKGWLASRRSAVFAEVAWRNTLGLFQEEKNL